MSKEKQMINTNRAVLVNFPSLSNSAYASIYVPFFVSEIHIKGVDVDWDVDYLTVYFLSSLVDNCPIGAAFAGVSSDTSTSTKKLRYIFPQPRDINSTFSFSYNLVDTISVVTFPDNHKGHVLFMIEFIGYM